MLRLVDFSASRIPPAEIKAAGYAGVVAYVSESRPGANFGAKPLTREYADALRAAGLQIVSNFQYGKPGGSAPSDYTRGFDGGVADARTALRLHQAAGGPDHAPIFFAIDEPITLQRWNDVAAHWFRGITSVLGVGRTGVYGHSRACSWAIEDGLVGHSSTPGRRWVWQTRAWSSGETEPTAVLYQDVIDTASNPGPLVGGVHVDVSEVRADDFGQWDFDRSTHPPGAIPVFSESADIRSPYCGPRDGVEVAWFVLHTEDGYSNSARNLADYLSNNDQEASYHYTVDNEGNVCDIVDTDSYANAALQPGNSKSINLAFAGSWAKWSRQTWFDRMAKGIDVAAYIAARDARRYGLSPEVISPEQAKHQTGITDHNGVRLATGVGNHTDIGPGFPWDYFDQRVREFAGETAREKSTSEVFGTSYPGSPITLGATGPHVIEVQLRLNAVADAGLLPDGEYAPLTRRAVALFQTSRGMDASGEVGPRTWAELFPGRQPPSRAVSEPTKRAAPASPGASARSRSLRAGSGRVAGLPESFPPLAVREVTGRELTTSVHMEAADLGIMRWDPDRGAIAAMFGDNFETVGWVGERQSPSIVMFDEGYRVIGVPTAGFGIAPDQPRRQLFYRPRCPEDYDTVLPCDFIKIGQTWTVAVMVSKGKLEGPGAQYKTEFWQSPDLVTWRGPVLQFDHRRPIHPGNTMLTFDQIDDWVYIFGTGGLSRDKPIWMWRNKADTFPMGHWEPWGFDQTRQPGWAWGIPNESSPILEGKHGELCFRHVDGNCVLSFLKRNGDGGGARMRAITLQSPEHDWRSGGNVVDYAFDYQIPFPYGGYISPLSKLNCDNGMHFWVSQWDQANNNERYRVLLVETALCACGGVRREPPLASRTTAAEGDDRTKRTTTAEESDDFPLPFGCYWGPLHGPDESWSNLFGNKPRSSKEGLARWQRAMGIGGSGVYDNATKEAAARLQHAKGWMPSLPDSLRGAVRAEEWDAVIRDGWRPPSPQPPSANPAGYDIGWYPGPGYADGHGAFLRIYLHTTEHQDWITRAEAVAQSQFEARADSDEVAESHHFLIDDDHIINTVATKNSARGLGQDDPVSVHIAMVCTSGSTGCWKAGSAAEANPNSESQPKTREQWLAHAGMLDMVAFVIATVATDYEIPLEWVDADGIAANRRGVSSHYNYSHGSQAPHGARDSDRWDVPPTFPSDHVLGLAREHCRTLLDPDRFPLPKGHYWGPLSGPQECWSNTHGGEPRSSREGLARWQTLRGVEASGCYDRATQQAAVELQQSRDWPITGCVSEREWAEVIGEQARRESARVSP